MSINQITQSITSGNTSSAQQISSLALWNHQFRTLDERVNRLMRFHKTKPAAMCLLGSAGAGKTHYANKKSEQLSRYAVDYGSHTTMPVLIVRAPKTSTSKTLIERMLHELGDIKPNYGTTDQKEKRLILMLDKLEVRLIVIDEIHDFLPKTKTGSSSQGLSWLKGFMDETLIPILFMGTQRAELVHKIDKELASRICYPAQLTSLPYGVDNYQKFEFAEMASAYAEHLSRPVKQLEFVKFDNEQPVFKNMNLLDRLFVATSGIPRGLRDVFLEIDLEMEDDANFTPNLKSLSEIYSGLASLENFIDFNPFVDANLPKVQAYIEKNFGGSHNEAA